MYRSRIRFGSAFVAASLALLCAGAFPQMVLAEPTTTMSTPFTTPATEDCPNRLVPPPPIDDSEVPTAGQTSPAPLPVPDQPVGGPALAACGVIVPTGASRLPEEISATSWAVFDLDSGEILGAKDPHGRYRPASTIKTLLAIIALRELDLSTVVTGTLEDANVDGTRVGIGPGGKYTNNQLMQALVMASGNDAANAIARQLGGYDATVAKMNDLAKSLGGLDTRVVTPSGLDGPGSATSAYDLAAFFREAMSIDKFAELIHTEQVNFPGFKISPTTETSTDENGTTTTKVITSMPGFPVGNDNALLFNYEGALGGKTGFTDDARQTFVAGAERKGRRLGVTLLKADVLPIRPWEQAARLLDWGFKQPSGRSVGRLDSADAESGTEATTEADTVLIAKPPTTIRDATASPGEQFLLLFGGGLVIVALIWGAVRLQRRKR